VDLIMVQQGRALPADADLVLLTGSKATRTDLELLYKQGWDIDIHAHVRQGGVVLGLCAGYQMLGNTIADPTGIEGPAGETRGLGLLNVNTILSGDKALRRVEGVDLKSGVAVSGYEMHIGETDGPSTNYPMLKIDDHNEGAISSDSLVSGCYVHGLFASDQFRSAYLRKLKDGTFGMVQYENLVEATLDGLAELCTQHLDLKGIAAAAGLN